MRFEYKNCDRPIAHDDRYFPSGERPIRKGDRCKIGELVVVVGDRSHADGLWGATRENDGVEIAIAIQNYELLNPRDPELLALSPVERLDWIRSPK